MLKRRIKKFYKFLIVSMFSKAKRKLKSDWIKDKCIVFDEFSNMIIPNAEYYFIYEDIPKSVVAHKWVGGQVLDDKIVAIPNDETRTLVKINKWVVNGKLSKELFKWSGGCIWNGDVYAFPRSANSFLRIGDIIEEIPLSFTYSQEHHYAGVCTREGIVYQPPRNTNHILKTDLRTGVSEKINLVSDLFKINFRYCGSIIHPNGFIYLFPESDDRVIKLNPRTDKWTFIGDRISTMVFDAKVGIDGNIYGYSAYCNGIMKIDVNSEKVEMIHKSINPGAYGTKYGVNGCLYSVPGDGSSIWKYDVLKNIVEKVFDLKSKQKAKYAGGGVTKKGEIYCIPAEETKILVMKPNINAKIPECIYKTFFEDNY